MKIAIYARVSKNDTSQDPQNQLNPLRDFAKAIGGEVVSEYVDLASGGKSDRESFLMMLSDADKRKFDLLLIWALDRLSREGISNTLGYMERLKKNGIAIKSLQESWLDTRDDGIGQLLIAVFSWVAQQERKRIVERTKAGLERAKREGKTLGRPTGKRDGRPRSRAGYFLRHKKSSP
ncbi:MAG: recombinase family protein [Candidatus Omnitrophica bacterium]|nr:recombinase family protein [Candidatus Omnitrophota bacterium]MDD5351726.1 recombinase family protein [Candidatus Omnitrophota bacterium]MDD5550936.1 recombinase family protein [Candidatus Omnitrophota bacterium]